MLGIISSRSAIKGQFAKNIRGKADRLTSGNLNDEDIAEQKFLLQSDSNIAIEWA